MKFYSGLSTPTINVITSAVIKSARGLVRDFGEVEQLQVSRKGLGDFVSIADHRSEDTLMRELSKVRPDYNFITEESGSISVSNSPYCWVIDPLDGTTNFLHGIPHFSIAVALMCENEVVAAVTYDPISDELFCAEKGRGAFLNHHRIRVSNRKSLEDSLTGIAVHTKIHYPEGIVSTRRLGSAALDLAYVACGRFDLFFGQGLKIWDVIGGSLLIKESGGAYKEKDSYCIGSNMQFSDRIAIDDLIP